MPNTRQSTRLASKRKREDVSLSDDSLNSSALTGLARGRPSEDVDAEAIMYNLNFARLGVDKLLIGIQSLRQENDELKTDLLRLQQSTNGPRTRSKSGQTSRRTEAYLRRQVQQLENALRQCKIARRKDRRTIEKLRAREVERDAKELADDEDGDAQGSELGQSAIQLLRRMSDLMDMNTLAEGEECAICMENMEVSKCYSLRCRHPVCTECFERLGNGTGDPLNCITDVVQCPHCREICPREECEIITQTAVQQWDSLLEISQEWARMDIGETDVGAEDNDEDSFISDDRFTDPESPQIPEPADINEELDAEVQAAPPASASPQDTGANSYQNLPSPSKRERLQMLAAQRATKRRV
ncbi:hypothetical protein BU15DRAFT_58188 [Melanogaster broomeanus]|nr:hypothetical protein BU15DRAFT_58188 [Melanogaster broomeanus]